MRIENALRSTAITFSCLALTACGGGGSGNLSGSGAGSGGGGGGGGIVPVTTSNAVELAPGRLAIDGLTNAEINAFGSLVEVTVNGVVRPTATVATAPIGTFGDGTNRLYRLAVAPDGDSFAVAGFEVGTFDANGNFVGGYAEAASPPPVQDATYTGLYRGELPAGNASVFGDITVSASFDSGTFSGNISNRDVVGIGAGFYDPAVIEENVGFGGTISASGSLVGGHNDGNSVGSLSGVAYSDGVVGVVELTHTGGGALFAPGQNPVEVGAFAAD